MIPHVHADRSERPMYPQDGSVWLSGVILWEHFRRIIVKLSFSQIQGKKLFNDVDLGHIQGKLSDAPAKNIINNDLILIF